MRFLSFLTLLHPFGSQLEKDSLLGLLCGVEVALEPQDPPVVGVSILYLA